MVLYITKTPHLQTPQNQNELKNKCGNTYVENCRVFLMVRGRLEWRYLPHSCEDSITRNLIFHKLVNSNQNPNDICRGRKKLRSEKVIPGSLEEQIKQDLSQAAEDVDVKVKYGATMKGKTGLWTVRNAIQQRCRDLKFYIPNR